MHLEVTEPLIVGMNRPLLRIGPGVEGGYSRSNE